jgi:PHD/YefM family antitoxin component YafN of YafNO toxin-antitoxin module
LTFTIIIAIKIDISGKDAKAMKFYTVTELRQRATQIVTEIEDSREEVVITKNGKPVVLMCFITEEAFSLKENVKEKVKEKRHGKGNL